MIFQPQEQNAMYETYVKDQAFVKAQVYFAN